MRIETAGIVSRKTGSRFCAIVRGTTDKIYIYNVKDDTTLNQTELMAVKFAAVGVTIEDVTISTPNQYVADMLQYEEKDSGIEWLKSPKSNAVLVDEIRSLIVQKKITIVYERNEQARNACKQ